MSANWWNSRLPRGLCISNAISSLSMRRIPKTTHHKRQECHHEGGQEDDGEGCPKPVGCVCDDVFHGIRRVNVDGIIAASSQYWNNHEVEV